jgi:hypothetical protein
MLRRGELSHIDFVIPQLGPGALGPLFDPSVSGFFMPAASSPASAQMTEGVQLPPNSPH